MTESPLQLREVATLSWTAARTRHGQAGESIETLQRAVEITKQWLVEAESEFLSHVEHCEAHSEGGSLREVQDAGDGSTSTCCLSAYLKAYKAGRFTSIDSEELKLLCQMHVAFSACVAEAESAIGKMSTKTRRRNRRRDLPRLIESLGLPQQVPSPDRTTSSSNLDSGNDQRKPLSRRITHVRRKSTTNSSPRDSDPGRSGEGVGARPVSSGSHSSAAYPSGAIERSPAKTGHVSISGVLNHRDSSRPRVQPLHSQVSQSPKKLKR